MEWISVNDQEPDTENPILAAHIFEGFIMWAASVWYDEREMEWVCDFTDDKFDKANYHDFTHWMPLPLPKPPEQE